MHDQLDRFVAWQFPRPTCDILLGIAVEIAFGKGKWIKRVEQAATGSRPALQWAFLRRYRPY